jgi:carbon-monoxide dehydrogenase large subunit
MSILGTRVIRTEDPRLLTVGGVYVDDLRTPELTGAARVTFVRSPVAHGRITGIDVTEASQEPGVIAVLTARDMDDLAPPPSASGDGVSEGPMPLGGPWSEPLLATGTVRFVGEPVAVVITDDRYQGEDAADLVGVDYEPLPAVVGPAAALVGESLLFPAAGTNIPFANPVSDDDAPFEVCDVVVEQDIVNQRVACMPMEGRATAAAFARGKLTVWHSSQNAQLCRLILCGTLGMSPDQIRVIVPDVGGGFGAKVGIDRDAIIVAWAARKTGRALRWAETRSENLVGMTQGRAQLHHIKIGGTHDGKILAYRIDVIQDSGAYGRMGKFLPGLTCLMAQGVYDIPEVQAGFRVVVTNATPVAAYRGAGRPEAAATVERAVDLFAAEIGMDPAEVRRRNFIAPDQFPFQTKTGALYDSGQYAEALDKVLTAAHYEELRQEQERRRARGDVRQLGIGVSTYVEITAADGAAGETAKLEVSDDGTATVYTGSSPHGQGHHTAWAMLVQEELGIPMGQVTVIHGDTDLIPVGVGTYASRSLQLGGSAVYKAAAEVKDEARHQVADMLEAAQADVMARHHDRPLAGARRPGHGPVLGPGRGPHQRRGLIADVALHRGRAYLPVRAAHVRGGGGHRDRQGHPAPARDRRRRRTGAQPGAGRGPAARRHRPGRGAGTAGRGGLRRRRQPADEPRSPTTPPSPPPNCPASSCWPCETPTTLNPLGVKGIGEAGTIGATPRCRTRSSTPSRISASGTSTCPPPQRVWTAINEARKAHQAQKASDQ